MARMEGGQKVTEYKRGDRVYIPDQDQVGTIKEESEGDGKVKVRTPDGTEVQLNEEDLKLQLED